MTPYKKRLNPYIQRMAEDMQLRNLAESPIDAYTWHADKFCQYFDKPADQLDQKKFASTNFIWSRRRKPRGVPSTRQSAGYVFSTRSLCNGLGRSAIFRLASDPRNCPWFCPT